jgi:hypothetical protein
MDLKFMANLFWFVFFLYYYLSFKILFKKRIKFPKSKAGIKIQKVSFYPNGINW